MSLRQLITIGILAVASIALLLIPGVPLGVPGEWVWNRHPLPATATEALLRLLWPAVIALGLWGVSLWTPRDDQVSRASLAGRYGVLLVTATVFSSAVQQAAPSPHRELKPLWVLYSPSASGYFLEATVAMPSTQEFLRGYEQRMEQGDVLHIGTHPPGLFLLSRYCIDACDASPVLTSFVDRVSGDASLAAFEELATMARLSRSLTPAETSGLQLLSLITRLAIPLTLLPLAWLISRLFGQTAAWRASCLWATLPCLAIFFPKSDALFPLTTMVTLSLAWTALNGRGACKLLAIPAGLVLWLGLMLSLAHLPVVAVLVLLTGTAWWRAGFDRRVIFSDVIVGGLMLTTIVICSSVWSVTNSCNLASVWWWNLTNHAGFYAEYSRTWAWWLLVNPVEFCLSVGVPVAACAMISLWRWREWDATDDRSPARRPITMVAGMSGVILLLWLSGKNQGEAARLWCFLTPWVLVIGGACFRSMCDRSWKALLSLQLLASVATVLRINGFSF